MGSASNNGAPWALSDNYHNTLANGLQWTQPITRQCSCSTRKTSLGGAGHQITFSNRGGVLGYYSMTAIEYSGLAPANSLDTTAFSSTFYSSALNYSSGPVVTSQAGELLLGVDHCYAQPAYTPTAPWSQIDQGVSDTSGGYLQTQDRVAGAGGSYADSGTLSAACGYNNYALIAAFKAGSASQAPPSISSFTATPASITAGQSSTLAWVVSGATSLSISGIGAVTGTQIAVTPLATTTYTLTATNIGGSVTAQATVTVTQDPAPPSVPTNLTATAISNNSIQLGWTPSMDNVAVAGYRIYRGGVQVGTSTTASYTDTGLLPSTGYTYTVAAYDAAGKVSAPLLPASATTQAVTLTRVQSQSTVGSSTSTLAVVLPSATTSGDNLIVAVASYYGGAANNGAPWTLTDTYHNTWRTAYVDTTDYPAVQLFYAENITGGAAHQITLADTGNVNGYFMVTAVEYAGLAQVNSLDTTTFRTALYSTATTYNSGSITTAQANELLFGMNYCYNPSDVYTPSSPWRQIDSANSGSSILQTQDEFTGVIGSYADSGTLSAACGYNNYALIAAFKAGSAAQAPPAISSFTATPASITAGQSSTLAWVVSGATSLSISGIGAVTGTQITVTPSATTTYTLTATNTNGSVTAQATVTVTAPPPVISSFTANPTTVFTGTSSTLSWNTSNATTVSISPGIGTVALNGSTSVTPAGTTTYTLTATAIRN